ncbi:MAG: hypothetical protein ACI9H8_002445, partial [Lysobacterales bacterium]
MAEWLTNSPGANLNERAARVNPKGEAQDASSNA